MPSVGWKTWRYQTKDLLHTEVNIKLGINTVKHTLAKVYDVYITVLGIITWRKLTVKRAFVLFDFYFLLFTIQ